MPADELRKLATDMEKLGRKIAAAAQRIRQVSNKDVSEWFHGLHRPHDQIDVAVASLRFMNEEILNISRAARGTRYPMRGVGRPEEASRETWGSGRRG